MQDEMRVKEMEVLLGIVSEYDQEIPQSQTVDKPIAPRLRATQPSRNLCN